MSIKQFLPRGSQLKNSKDITAMVVYTGTDTKIAMNQGKYSMKISDMAMKLNYYMLVNLAIVGVSTLLLSQIATRITT